MVREVALPVSRSAGVEVTDVRSEVDERMMTWRVVEAD